MWTRSEVRGRTRAYDQSVGHRREFYELFYRVLRDHGCQQYRGALKAKEHRAGAPAIEGWLRAAGLESARAVTEELKMWFADAEALFLHPLTRLGFLTNWLAVVAEQQRSVVFQALCDAIDDAALPHGLTVTVPVLFMAAVKPRWPLLFLAQQVGERRFVFLARLLGGVGNAASGRRHSDLLACRSLDRLDRAKAFLLLARHAPPLAAHYAIIGQAGPWPAADTHGRTRIF